MTWSGLRARYAIHDFFLQHFCAPLQEAACPSGKCMPGLRGAFILLPLRRDKWPAVSAYTFPDTKLDLRHCLAPCLFFTFSSILRFWLPDLSPPITGKMASWNREHLCLAEPTPGLCSQIVSFSPLCQDIPRIVFVSLPDANCHTEPVAQIGF